MGRRAELLKGVCAAVVQIGVSSFMWRQQHVVGHHSWTNLACDPDIRVSDHDVRRVAPHQPRQPYHVRPYAMCSLVAVKMQSVFVWCGSLCAPSPPPTAAWQQGG